MHAQAQRAPGGSPENQRQAQHRGPLNPNYIGRNLLLEGSDESAGPPGGHPEAVAAAGQRNFVALRQAPRPAHFAFAGLLANPLLRYGRPEPAGPTNGR